MPRYTVPRNTPVRLEVVLFVEKPTVLRVRGSEKKVANTVYFDRLSGSGESPVSGRKALYFNFPFSLSKLEISAQDIHGRGSVNIERIRRVPIHTKALQGMERVTREFVLFAKWFSYSCGNLLSDAYQDQKKQFSIHYLDEIRDHETGVLIATPARVNHATGLIEVSRKDFVPMTVVNRFYILMHEFTHFSLNTTDEVECDLHAAQMCLDLGFDKMETLNSVAKLFLFNTDLPDAQRLEQERRVAVVKDFVEKYAIAG